MNQDKEIEGTLNLFDVMMRKEDLHDDLKNCLYEGASFLYLSHPLVQQVPYAQEFNAIVNQQYRAKLDASEKALKDGDVERYIWLHERPYRLDAFVRFNEIRDLVGSDYWNTLSSIYTDSENIYQNLEIWFDCLSSDKDGKNFFMSEEEQEFLNSLPDEVTIYRGINQEDYDEGFSWSLKKDVAEFFANRFGKQGKILTKKVNKTDIFAYLDRRNEFEILIIT